MYVSLCHLKIKIIMIVNNPRIKKFISLLFLSVIEELSTALIKKKHIPVVIKKAAPPNSTVSIKNHSYYKKIDNYYQL